MLSAVPMLMAFESASLVMVSVLYRLCPCGEALGFKDDRKRCSCI